MKTPKFINLAFLEKTGGQASTPLTVTVVMLGAWEIGCFEQEGVHSDAGVKGKVILSD